MLNLLIADQDDIYDSPCKYGEILDGHACYCSNDDANITKCPIWRNFGCDLEYWHANDDWNDENSDWKNGGCKYFEANSKN